MAAHYAHSQQSLLEAIVANHRNHSPTFRIDTTAWRQKSGLGAARGATKTHAQVDDEVSKFLERGGEITQVPTGASGVDPQVKWQDFKFACL